MNGNWSLQDVNFGKMSVHGNPQKKLLFFAKQILVYLYLSIRQELILGNVMESKSSSSVRDMTPSKPLSLTNVKIPITKIIFRLQIKFASTGMLQRDNSIFIVNPCRFLFPHFPRWQSYYLMTNLLYNWVWV